MALPPKGDPQRPLHLAVRFSRIAGFLFIGLGTWATLLHFFSMRRAGNAILIGSLAEVALASSLVYFGPGAIYLVCSVFIARRRRWAVFTAMVLAGIQILLIGWALVMFAKHFVSADPAARDWSVVLPLGITLLISLVLAQLEHHLTKSFEAIRLAPVDVQRGFEPLPAAPLVPVALGSGDDDAPPAAR